MCWVGAGLRLRPGYPWRVPEPPAFVLPLPLARGGVDCLYPLLTLCPGMACSPVCSLVVLRKLLALLFQELLPLLFLLLPHGLSLLLFQEQLPLPLLDNVPWGLRGPLGELAHRKVIPR